MRIQLEMCSVSTSCIILSAIKVILFEIDIFIIFRVWKTVTLLNLNLMVSGDTVHTTHTKFPCRPISMPVQNPNGQINITVKNTF